MRSVRFAFDFPISVSLFGISSIEAATGPFLSQLPLVPSELAVALARFITDDGSMPFAPEPCRLPVEEAARLAPL